MAITLNGTTGITTPDVDSTADISVNGLTVGKGAGNVATNTAVGTSALAANTTGVENTAVGSGSLDVNTSGSNNTAVGTNVLGANTTGSQNSGVGRGVLVTNTSGSNNTAMGHDAMALNTTGSFNVGIGRDALVNNTTASGNTAVGYKAGYSQTTGGTYGSNTFVGTEAGRDSTTGDINTFIGAGAGYLVTTGARNTILGAYSGNQGGLDIRTSSNYIVLSDGNGNPNAYCDTNGKWTIGVGGTTNNSAGTIRINGASGSGLGWFIDGLNNGTRTNLIGNYSQIAGGTATWLTLSNTGGGVYLNGATATSWTAVSDETRKVIIEPITDGLNKVSTLRTVIGRLKTDEENVRRPYLIAQDVQKVLPEAVTEAEDKEGKHLGLSYTEVIPLLVNAIQELSAQVTALQAEVNTLKGN